MNRRPWRDSLVKSSSDIFTHTQCASTDCIFATLQTITFTRLTAYWACISSRSSCHTLSTLCRILGGSTFSGALQLINWSGYLVFVFTCSQWLAHLYVTLHCCICDLLLQTEYVFLSPFWIRCCRRFHLASNLCRRFVVTVITRRRFDLSPFWPVLAVAWRFFISRLLIRPKTMTVGFNYHVD